MLLLASTLVYSAYLSLCLAMPRHYGRVFEKEAGIRGRIMLRCGGWLGIALSLALCIHAEGWQFGPVYWVGSLVVSGMLLVFLLPYRPRIATCLCLAAPAAFLSMIFN